jgi:hypothetical protein
MFSIVLTYNTQRNSCYKCWNRFKFESSMNFKMVQTIWEKSDKFSKILSWVDVHKSKFNWSHLYASNRVTAQVLTKWFFQKWANQLKNWFWCYIQFISCGKCNKIFLGEVQHSLIIKIGFDVSFTEPVSCENCNNLFLSHGEVQQTFLWGSATVFISSFFSSWSLHQIM